MASVEPHEDPPTEAQATNVEPQDVSMDAPKTDEAKDGDAAQEPLSKNALKRMRKRQAWEEGRQDRALRRKEKRSQARMRKRTERKEMLSQGVDPSIVFPKKEAATQVPVAIVLDCDFEQYMLDKERISLASQITRCYSDNKGAKYKAHLWINGWTGKLKDRFENVLGNQHAHWKSVGFEENGFLDAAKQARTQLQDEPGEMISALQKSLEQPCLTKEGSADADPEIDPNFKDVIYLSSDSPYTIQRLEPNKTYVVGGLVDKNREKGLCHRRATQLGIRTARLPIGDFMVMQSRQVLATNHVVEIMLKWLEYEDWGEAFLSVIPKRKGGILKGDANAEGEDQQEEEVDDDEGAADQEEEQKVSAAADTQNP